MSAPTIAIVGSGPAGCYLAQALRKQWPQAPIELFDRLPVPFGLVRYGVAPDHLGTKAVTRQFERLFERDGVQFRGNIKIGRDLSLSALQKSYDVVVLATGLAADRPLEIPGSELKGIYGAGSITRRFNDHPEEQAFAPALGRSTVIVGQGNVAIDVLRLLAKSPEAFADSEVSDSALAHFQRYPLARIDIVGRSPAAQAKCDALMLRELSKLDSVRFHFSEPLEHDDADGERAATARMAAFEELAALPAPDKVRCKVHFHFGWVPERILGTQRVEHVAFTSGDGSGRVLQLDADSVITAIGFAEREGQVLSRSGLGGETVNESGRLAPGLYCTGWFRRGPQGTIPQNRVDARKVAEAVAEDWAGRTSSKPGFAGLPASVNEQATDYAGWKRIETVEFAEAPAGRLRLKISDMERMLGIARHTT